ncbi:MAG: light-harvesting antenna LH1, beta subunit [Gemmatimonadaceae bacterium]
MCWPHGGPCRGSAHEADEHSVLPGLEWARFPPPVPRGYSRDDIPTWRWRMSSNGGMNEEDARRFHGQFMLGTISWVAVAVVAHFLAWSWRPWF